MSRVQRPDWVAHGSGCRHAAGDDIRTRSGNLETDRTFTGYDRESRDGANS